MSYIILFKVRVGDKWQGVGFRYPTPEAAKAEAERYRGEALIPTTSMVMIAKVESTMDLGGHKWRDYD